MTDNPAKPVFTPKPFKVAIGWYVLVEWPDGRDFHVGDFSNEADALYWIEHDSADWLATRA